MKTDAARSQKLISSERGPRRNFDLYEATDRVALHVDGTSGVALGPALSRIDFYRVAEVSVSEGKEAEALEVREAHLTIAMPTLQLAEFVTILSSALANGEAKIVEAMDANKEGFREFVRKLKGNDGKH